MRRQLSLLALVAAAGFLTAAVVTREVTASPNAHDARPSFTLKGKVTRVVDGDTLIVRVGRRNERVRLIGVDTPEVGACYATEATVLARKLSLTRLVRLDGDGTQSRRDRYGRLLA